MTTGNISYIICVRHSTGVDMGPFNVFGQLPAVLPGSLGQWPMFMEWVKAFPGIAESIDEAGNYPDDLYITTATQGGLENSIWPGGGTYGQVYTGQLITPNLSLDFGQYPALNLSLWDHDDASADDLCGSIGMFQAERGLGDITKKAVSSVEGSCYYVTYNVT